MRFVFDLGIWFADNDIEHRTVVIDDPEIDHWFVALSVAVQWQMDVGRNLNRDKQSPNSWPSTIRRPKNVTSWKLLLEESHG